MPSQTTESNADETRGRMKPGNIGTSTDQYDEESAKDLIGSLWKDVENETDREEAFTASSQVLNKQIETLIRAGLEAFHRGETAETELSHLKEKMKQRDAELDRLRSTADKNAATLTNLMSNADQSHKEAQDLSRRITVEANLRAELSNTIIHRDEAIAEAETYKRQVLLLQEDLRNQKAKVASVTQEKVLIARDLEAHRRSSTSVAMDRPQQSSEYYKRKASELNGRLQASKIACAEKSRRIQQLEDEIARNTMKSSLSGRDGKRMR